MTFLNQNRKKKCHFIFFFFFFFFSFLKFFELFKKVTNLERIYLKSCERIRKCYRLSKLPLITLSWKLPQLNFPTHVKSVETVAGIFVFLRAALVESLDPRLRLCRWIILVMRTWWACKLISVTHLLPDPIRYWPRWEAWNNRQLRSFSIFLQSHLNISAPSFGQGSALQKVPNGILMGVTFVFENVDNDSWFGVFYGSSADSKTEMDPCQICEDFSNLHFLIAHMKVIMYAENVNVNL